MVLRCPMNNIGSSCIGFVWLAMDKAGGSLLIYRNCNPERFATKPRFQNFRLIFDEQPCCKLGIDNIKLEDQGTYRCETAMPNGQSSDIDVEVIGK